MTEEEKKQFNEYCCLVDFLRGTNIFHKILVTTHIELMLEAGITWSSIKRITNITQGQYKRMRKKWLNDKTRSTYRRFFDEFKKKREQADNNDS